MDVNELTKLCVGKYSELHITFNDFKSNYQTAAEAIGENFHGWYDPDSFASPEEIERCKQTNTIWEIQWYPDTPVGFHKVIASTFEAAAQAAIATARPAPAEGE